MKEIFVHLDRCLGCHTCEIACAVEHSQSKSLFGAILVYRTVPEFSADVRQVAAAEMLAGEGGVSRGPYEIRIEIEIRHRGRERGRDGRRPGYPRAG